MKYENGQTELNIMYSCFASQPGAARERDRTMKTALHYCAESASIACADIILSAARDLVDARDEDGYTPLHLAVIAGNRPLIKFLLSKNADVNCLDYERHSVIHWATGKCEVTLGPTV
jgi:ankyrin repeat protein